MIRRAVRAGRIIQPSVRVRGGKIFRFALDASRSTFAHETGHMFWARDEYLGGGSYLDFRGYYDTQNWNAVNNPTPGFVHQPSIMASGSSLEFAYQTNTSAASTLEMIGWRDSNGNGIFDVLDVPHRLEGVGTFDQSCSNIVFRGTRGSRNAAQPESERPPKRHHDQSDYASGVSN
jgi:hypothetical protein